MKKLLTLAVLAAVAGVLVGCGAKEEGDTAAKPADTTSTPSTTPSTSPSTEPTSEKPTDDKAAAGSSMATPPAGGATGTATPPTDKPADDKAAAPK